MRFAEWLTVFVLLLAPAERTVFAQAGSSPGGPVAHWPLDAYGGDVAADDMHVLPGYVYGDRLWQPYEGRVDGCLEFDGLGDFIDCGNDPAFDFTEAITVAAWIRVRQFDRSYQAIVTKGDSSFRLQRNDGQSTLEFACTGVQVPGNVWGSVFGSVPIDDGQWHHVAGTYDGLQVSLYVDGLLDAATSGQGQIAVTSHPVLIGENAEQTRRYWNGWIDDVRLYDYALSREEIGELAACGRTWHVDAMNGRDTNSGDSRTQSLASIQAAIDAAQDDDKVLLWPGLYRESVHFMGKAVTVASAAEAAILEAPMGYAVTFNGGELADSVLRNVVIRNSQYAVYITSGGRPTLRNLTIVENNYGVRAFDGANPNISNCIFWGNTIGDLFQCSARSSWLRNDLPVMPTVWWRFDEGMGNTADDALGYNDGVVYGATWERGQAGRGLDFDGSGDYVLVRDTDAVSVGNRDYTLSAWIYPRRVDGVQTIISKVADVVDKEYMLSLEEGQLRLDVERDANNGREYAPAPLRANQWQHVAVTFDSVNLDPTFYHNGQMQVSDSAGRSPIIALPDRLTDDLCIGYRGGDYGGYGFDGRIDEVMIFDRVLSPAEMQLLYEYGCGPMFADPERSDYHLRSERGRYQPVDPNTFGAEGLWVLDDATSPCVDQGESSDACGAEPEPNGARINLGAYGGTRFASRSEWPLPGDVNRDGIVDYNDLAVFADEWLVVIPAVYRENPPDIP